MYNEKVNNKLSYYNEGYMIEMENDDGFPYLSEFCTGVINVIGLI